MGLPYAGSFRERVVCQGQRPLARDVSLVPKAFLTEERSSPTDPFLRAARAIGAPIAQWWAKRRHERHFIAKVTDADTSPAPTGY